MKEVLFIVDTVFENQGIQSLSALLKSSGYATEAIYYQKKKTEQVLTRILAMSPLLVGFSVTSMDFQWTVDLARHIKKLGIPVVFGGPHPTYFPEFIDTEGVDIICRGEGEYPLLELVQAIENGVDFTGIKNLWVKSGGKIFRNELRCLIEELDVLPYLDREIFYRDSKLLAGFSSKRFLVGRGCPYDCTYCHNHELRAVYYGKGRFVRFRSPENIIAEIKKVRKEYGMKTVSFCADTFTQYPRLSEFLDQYKKEIGLPFFCQGRFNELTEELTRKLSEAGCFYMALGVETGSEPLRNIVLKRRMTDKQIECGSALLHKYGIKFIVYVMFGLPGETLADSLKTVELVGRINADSISPTVYQPIVKTELWNYMVQHDLFETNSAESFSHFSYKSPVKLKHKREILNLHKIAFIGAKYPVTLPLIRLIIKLPHNLMFKLLNYYNLLKVYRASRAMGLSEVMRLAWHIRRMQ